MRENDQALVCVHKEGIKMGPTTSACYSIVAVYLRIDDPSLVRFVVGSWHAQEVLLTENTMAAQRLIRGSDLDVQWKSSGHATFVWKHKADEFKPYYSHNDAVSSSASVVGPRIYSSESTVNRLRYSVHIYGTNETDYTVELISKRRNGKDVHEMASLHNDPVVNKLILHKRTVNPYGVYLSSSNFADLLSLTRFEQTIPVVGSDDFGHTTHIKWKATVSPKWSGKLANYVRVLRLAKHACKVSGVFCFVTVFIVQQKTEFRAHLQLNLTWLAPILFTRRRSNPANSTNRAFRLPSLR